MGKISGGEDQIDQGEDRENDDHGHLSGESSQGQIAHQQSDIGRHDCGKDQP
jgi:hypothetical protein